MDIFNSPDSMTSDPASNFTARAEQLARRRKLAEQLVAQGMQNNGGSGYQGGRVFIVGNPLGGLAQSLAGTYMGSQADKEASQLASDQQRAQSDWSQRYNQATPEQQQGLLIEARNKGLKYDLEQAFAKEERDRIEKGEQLAADRVAKAEEAEANRIEQGQQKAADRVARQELRATPTIHITTGGAQSGKFAGAITQLGIDPRDGTPIYRHTKSGEAIKFDDKGNAVMHEGAIAPKPAAQGQPTESERSSAGFLGRMQEAEKNIVKIKGGEQTEATAVAGKIPGVGEYARRKVESVAQQKYRQSADDWIRAKLRKESGAVIGKEEMEQEYRTYFPQPGDSNELKAQKAQARMQAQEQMRSSAGRSKPTQAAPVAEQPKPTVAPGTRGMHKGKPVVMGADGEWHYAN